MMLEEPLIPITVIISSAQPSMYRVINNLEEPHDEGVYGAKGVGEPALAPTAPVITNAISDAAGI